MAKRFRYIQERDGATVYRREVPPGLQKVLGRTAWTKTLRPGLSDTQVSAIVERLAREHDAIIARARGEELGPADIAAAEARAGSA